jgi:D-alanyl-D-alanine carboxypeptidase
VSDPVEQQKADATSPTTSTVTLVEVSGSSDKNRMTSDVITRILDKLAMNNVSSILDG